jgi:hypothetical protein
MRLNKRITIVKRLSNGVLLSVCDKYTLLRVFISEDAYQPDLSGVIFYFQRSTGFSQYPALPESINI